MSNGRSSTGRSAGSGSSRSTSSRAAGTRTTGTRSAGNAKGTSRNRSGASRSTFKRVLFEPIGKTPIERAREGEKLPRYIENTGNEWTSDDLRNLQRMANENVPTRVIGLQLGRSVASVRTKANQEEISLKPTNQSPYGNK